MDAQNVTYGFESKGYWTNIRCYQLVQGEFCGWLKRAVQMEWVAERIVQMSQL